MPDGERRLAAIMFTDIVGYTALTQEKESAALQILEEHRELLRPIFIKHRGREAKTIGDAFLVEFGSALEATLCAVDIQNSLHSLNLERGGKLQVRIGIHVGDVVRQGEDVLGDAVNVSSRIYPLADPGGICISEQVYDQVKNKLELPLVSLGERSLKNVSGGVEVYKVSMPWDVWKVTPLQLDKNRIAVLPFTNMSADPQDEYFADGMTEELITAMSGLQGLQVIARTSVMNYKKKEKSVSEIGTELRVGTILEGSVRKAGVKVRVTAQLIDVPTESHLWSEKYDRELDDIFKIQDDISQKIAGALRVRLTTVQELGRKRPENIEAYTLYLRGRSLWYKRDREGVLGSIKLFQEAIKIDPSYAKAYAGLADAYSIAVGNKLGIVESAEGLAKSKEAATKALELDDTLAEGHASLGLNLWHEKRLKAAIMEFQRAIELNPSYASAHQWCAQVLLGMGNKNEASIEIEKAHELDPLFPITTGIMGWIFVYNGDLEKGISVFDRLMETDPDSPVGYWSRFVCSVYKGTKERAYDDLEAFHRVQKDEGDLYKAGLAMLSGVFGEKAKARQVLEEILPKVGKSFFEGDIAEWYALLGDKDESFNWIGKALAANNISLAELLYCPGFASVRGDPRFSEIVKKLNLS